MENDFMLNEDKIKLMTGIALFEKHEKHIFFRRTAISAVIISAAGCSAHFLPIRSASFYVP